MNKKEFSENTGSRLEELGLEIKGNTIDAIGVIVTITALGLMLAFGVYFTNWTLFDIIGKCFFALGTIACIAMNTFFIRTTFRSILTFQRMKTYYLEGDVDNFIRFLELL